MKTQTKVIYLLIIAILGVIVIFQGLKRKNENVLSMDLLQQLIEDRKAILAANVDSEHCFFSKSVTADHVSDFTDYCINNNNEDSINKFVDIVTSSINYRDKN